MKFVIVFVALFALACAAPPYDAEVQHYESNIHPEGFKYSVALSDGSAHDEEGQLKDVGTEVEAIVVRGSYQYVGDDGVTYKVNYIADENGYRPEGAHLPVA